MHHLTASYFNCLHFIVQFGQQLQAMYDTAKSQLCVARIHCNSG